MPEHWEVVIIDASGNVMLRMDRNLPGAREWAEREAASQSRFDAAVNLSRTTVARPLTGVLTGQTN